MSRHRQKLKRYSNNVYLFAERMIDVIEIKLDYKLSGLEKLSYQNRKRIIECKRGVKLARSKIGFKERSRSRHLSIEKQDSRFFQKLVMKSKSPMYSKWKGFLFAWDDLLWILAIKLFGNLILIKF